MASVEANGVRISYDVRGSGDPVVLIAGLGQPAMAWNQAMVPALIDAGYEVITFDNRGMEPSASPPPPYTVAEMAADAVALLDALDRGPYHLAGYSLGAFIAEELSIERPDLVRSATFIAGLNVSSAYEKLRYKTQRILAEQLDPLPREVECGGALLLLTNEQLQDDAVVTRWAALLKMSKPWNRDGRIGQWSAVESWTARTDPIERYRRIQAPSLVVTFEHDVDCPPGHSKLAADVVPDATCVQIDGVGHLGVFEQQEQVAGALLEFLRGR